MDLSKIYSLRKQYTVIGITGRTGSGCTEVANMLKDGFINDNLIYPKPDDIAFDKEVKHNSFRKYKIVYNYARENFKKHTLINYKDVLMLYILSFEYSEFVRFLKSTDVVDEFKKSKLKVDTNFENEILELNKIKNRYENIHKKIVDFKLHELEIKRESNDCLKLYTFFDSEEFKTISEEIGAILKLNSLIKRNKILQIVANNLRKSGNPFKTESKPDIKYCFTISELINDLIKGLKNKLKNSSLLDKNVEVVIDSLRNPLEIMFFKQRFSAFYIMAVNREDEIRNCIIKQRFDKEDIEDIEKILLEEHSGAKAKDFFKQNVSMCLQNADIHITFRDKTEIDTLNKNINDNTSPYYSVGMQLLKYVSLIDHPGLVTPSPEERCMQLAYTAKYNSGCISRQVGAAITDKHYSIKAIGWNNTPEGQVPCNLRNVEDLFHDIKDSGYSPFEQNEKFVQIVKPYFQSQIIEHKDDLCGRNVCFCFKSIYNSKYEGKNQVHTRSLHAEESAFLQISKYGGTGIKNGKLFTTASPCELCSKKAYQLGIKIIYYIDPYPGISKDQILNGGSINPQVRLFNGAIGNAYHWLYEPIMPYKDELALILEHEIKDLTKTYEETNKLLSEENLRLKAELNSYESKDV